MSANPTLQAVQRLFVGPIRNESHRDEIALRAAGYTISRNREDFDELVKKRSESTQVIPLRGHRSPER
jgi:hypothetical protein